MKSKPIASASPKHSTIRVFEQDGIKYYPFKRLTVSGDWEAQQLGAAIIGQHFLYMKRYRKVIDGIIKQTCHIVPKYKNCDVTDIMLLIKGLDGKTPDYISKEVCKFIISKNKKA